MKINMQKNATRDKERHPQEADRKARRTRNRIWRTAIAAVIAATILAGCISTGIPVAVDVDPLGWRTGDTLAIRLENADTVGMYDIGLLVRCDKTFAEQQLPLNIRITTPDSLRYEEELTATFLDDVPKNTDYSETLIPYRRQVQLATTGTYMFEIVPRKDNVRGIWSVGIVRELSRRAN
ncbi:gliding motility lipoprotein GldH [Alistipes sp. OttesenSCG-928-B03]|nr:gliding motility lipoprotein GldH [Alistipes sp. OttesenSCG-928-B03]